MTWTGFDTTFTSAPLMPGGSFTPSAVPVVGLMTSILLGSLGSITNLPTSEGIPSLIRRITSRAAMATLTTIRIPFQCFWKNAPIVVKNFVIFPSLEIDLYGVLAGSNRLGPDQPKSANESDAFALAMNLPHPLESFRGSTAGVIVPHQNLIFDYRLEEAEMASEVLAPVLIDSEVAHSSDILHLQ